MMTQLRMLSLLIALVVIAADAIFLPGAWHHFAVILVIGCLLLWAAVAFIDKAAT